MDDGIRIGTAATALGVSIDTLRRWERAGRVTFAAAAALRRSSGGAQPPT